MLLHLGADVEPVAGYRLVRLLGRGGFGEVWEATAPGKVPVALKFIRLETREAEAEQRALDVIRNLSHPHLLDVQFAIRVKDCLVIAMPLCGQTLMHRLGACQDQGLFGLPRHELHGYMADLSRAVDYLNEPRHPSGDDGRPIGVQHRDIKPHNIFLSGDSVKLADFGLAKIAVSSDSVHMAGTADYMSPEAIRGRVSQWSDQYSLAVTYVQLRTGKLPFEGDSVVHFIYAHLEKAPDLSGLPDEERPVLARALAKAPEERWSNCRAFVRALVTASRTVNSSIPPESRTATPRFSIRVDDIDTSPTGEQAEADDLRRRHSRRFGPAGLSAIFAVFVAMLVISRLSPSTDRTPRGLPPTTGTIPPFNLKTIKPSDAAASRPGNRGTPELPNPRPTPTVEPPKLITNTLGMKLTLIPAGEFLMGSPEPDRDARSDEKPHHRVRFTRPFYLGETEVTVGQFRRVVEASGYLTEAEKDGIGGWGWNEANGEYKQDPKYTWRNPGFTQTDEHPVVNVSWDDAIAYCNMLSETEGLNPYYRLDLAAGIQRSGDGYRLPTEAEWEYACRAGTTTSWESGDDPEKLALVGNIADGTAVAKYTDWKGAIAARDGYVFTAPVARFRPNAFGVYDMHGNVWEWCWDWYEGRYYGQSPGADPPGPSQGKDRVIRGGGWHYAPRFCRSASRLWRAPTTRNNYSVGFRVARSD